MTMLSKTLWGMVPWATPNGYAYAVKPPHKPMTEK